MGSERIPAFVFVAVLALAGCRTADSSSGSRAAPDDAAVPEDPGGWNAPASTEDPGACGTPDGAPPPEVVERATRFLFGAWGFDGRVQGHVEGSPASFSTDASGIPGFSFEARFSSRKEDPDAWTNVSFLLEHFRNAEDRDVPGGRARAEGALTGGWLAVGLAGKPFRDGSDVPVDFSHRIDFLFGLRRGAVQAEVPDGYGGTYSRSSTWGEVALGLRAEWSPVRRVFLFARGDIGSEFNPRALLDDEDAEGDSAVGAQSFQFSAGLRVRPVDHVSLIFGWRYLRLDGKELVHGGTEDVATARVTWSGPWAGLEVDF